MHPLVDTGWLAREIDPGLRVVDVVRCPDPAREDREAWRAGRHSCAASAPWTHGLTAYGVPVILAPPVLRRDSGLALPFTTGDAPG